MINPRQVRSVLLYYINDDCQCHTRAHSLARNKMDKTEFYHVDDVEFNSLCTKRPPYSVYDIYEIDQQLQSGGFGTVFAGRRKIDDLAVAIKRVWKPNVISWCINGDRKVTGEIFFLEKLRDVDGIVRLINYFELEDEYLLVLDRKHDDQDLFDFIADSGTIDEKTSWRLFTQILHINANMYTFGIVHRDIKGENVIVNKYDCAVKMIDFGSAASFALTDVKSYPATSAIAPYEWVTDGSCEHEGLLMWSLGILLYNMTHGDEPFKTSRQIVNGVLNLNAELSMPCRDFISRCLNRDTSRRLSLKQAISHDWINTVP